eukprot:6185935-Pleurochrysis_carterae.AAC.5
MCQTTAPGAGSERAYDWGSTEQLPTLRLHATVGNSRSRRTSQALLVFIPAATPPFEPEAPRRHGALSYAYPAWEQSG